jgi:hypothetical protein
VQLLKKGFEQIGGLRTQQSLSPIWCPENFNLTKLKFSRKNPLPSANYILKYRIEEALY